ncbi:MAG TPA: hypothetical protein VEK80_11325 [Kribbellaceae bacterium]|nr:hypothetical protein [Kribbellaceae bacterium]
MLFEEFYAERARVVREATGFEQLAGEVERLRRLAETVEDDPAKARRYVEATETLLAEAFRPRSATLRQAFAAMLRARRLPSGTPAEQRAHVLAGIDAITRIAAHAPDEGERDAALELNEALRRALWRIDQASGDAASGDAE